MAMVYAITDDTAANEGNMAIINPILQVVQVRLRLDFLLLR